MTVETSGEKEYQVVQRLDDNRLKWLPEALVERLTVRRTAVGSFENAEIMCEWLTEDAKRRGARVKIDIEEI